MHCTDQSDASQCVAPDWVKIHLTLEETLRTHLLRQEHLLAEHAQRMETLWAGAGRACRQMSAVASLVSDEYALLSNDGLTESRLAAAGHIESRPATVDATDSHAGPKVNPYMSSASKFTQVFEPAAVAIQSYKKKCDHVSVVSTIRSNIGAAAADVRAEWVDWWLELEEPRREGVLHDLVTSRYFELLCASVIVINTCVMVYNTNMEAYSLQEDSSVVLRVLNISFAAFYFVELASKLAVHRLYYFCNAEMAWNIFDFVLVVTSIVDLAIVESSTSAGSNMNHMRTMRLGIRTLRATKVLRTFRLIRFFTELRLILHSVIGSFVSLFWSIIMLIFMFFIFAIVFVRGATDTLISSGDQLDPGVWDILRHELGSTQAAILMLFKSTTGGKEWVFFFDILSQTGPQSAALFLFFIAFSNIALLNILTGIFVENAMKLAQPDRDTAALQQRKRDLVEAAELRRLCRSVDTEHTGYISEQQFMEQMHNDHFKARLALMGLDIKHAALFFDCICADFKKKEVEIEAFVSAAMRLKGLATSLDLQTVTLGTKIIHDSQLRLFAYLEARLGPILDGIASDRMDTRSPPDHADFSL